MFSSVGKWFTSWFKSEEQVVVDFFRPLIDEVKKEALHLGKDNLQVGMKIIKDAAMAAAVAGISAPPGTKTAVAEATFIAKATADGVTAIHNAEAAAIKAAVAIIRSKPELAVVADTVLPDTTKTS